MGPIGVKKHLAPFLPAHPVVIQTFHINQTLLIWDEFVSNASPTYALNSPSEKWTLN